MLKFFFNRDSWMVKIMEVLGICAYGIFTYKVWPHLDRRFFLMSFIIVCYAFIRLCDLYAWHGGKDRSVGIRVHFQKAIVPTSYIMAVTSLLCLFTIPFLSTLLIVLAVLMMLVVTPVNGILIYFYFKDKDPLPINYFSGNHYIQAERGNEGFKNVSQ